MQNQKHSKLIILSVYQNHQFQIKQNTPLFPLLIPRWKFKKITGNTFSKFHINETAD